MVVNMRYTKCVFLILFALFCQFSKSQNKILQGKVMDTKGEVIPFANLYLKKALSGVIADENGSFKLDFHLFPDTLVVSFIGYKSLKYFISENTNSRSLSLKLEENTALLSEVTVTTYKDPGKHIMKMVLANKAKNDINRFDNYVFNEYRKTEIDAFNLDTLKSRGLLNRIAKVYGVFNSEKSKDKAPVYFSEKFYRTYHSNNLQTHIEHLVSEKQLGLETDKLEDKFNGFALKVNIYNSVIPMFKVSFLSPVSELGLLYYKFIPIDTINSNDGSYIKLQVKPKVRNENTFDGYIWVEDESFAITKYQLKSSEGSNINFVDEIRINFDYINSASSIESKRTTWLPSKSNIEIEFKNGWDLIGIPISGDSTSVKIGLTYASTYGGYIVNSETINQNNFFDVVKINDSVTVKSANVNTFDDAFRLDTLSSKELAIYKAIDSLKKDKRFLRETKITSFLASGFWDFGCKLRLGPYSSFLSTNQIEGLRSRLSLWTLPCFNKQINLNGYMAYGFKDKVLKGGLGIKYVPKRKNYCKTELFVRSDYDALLDYDDELDKDNLFTLALRKNIPAYMVFTQQVKLLQEIELNKDFSCKAFLNIKSLNPTFDYSYYKFIDEQIVDFNPLKKLNVNEAGFTIRYGHNERTTIFNYDKIRISSPYPVIGLTYVYGFEGTSNTYFEYHKINLNVTHEFNLPFKGSFFYHASFGKMFGLVPAILLFTPAGNAYYVSNKYTFNVMLPYEFAADHYASIMTRYNMGGLILDKIPLLNKLHLRERFVFNAYLGGLNQQNKDFNSINPLKTTGNQPYTEAGIGIGNIFNVLSIDAVWRTSQFNSSNKVTRFGIFTTVSIVF